MGYTRNRVQSHRLLFRREVPQSTVASPEDGVFLSPRVAAGSPDRAHCRLPPSIPGGRGCRWAAYAAWSSLAGTIAAWISAAQRKPTSSLATATAATFGLLPPMTIDQYFL